MRDPEVLHVQFHFHPELCVGCGACVTACMDEHDAFPMATQPLRRLYRTEHVRAGVGQISWYSLACLHCENPYCAAACPNDCFSTDSATGTVQLDATGCVGCGACVNACPFRGIVFTSQDKADKCDGCLSRLREGLRPRCVDACPRHAITIDDRPAVRRTGREKLSRLLKSEQLR